MKFFFILISYFLIVPSLAVNQIGCLINEDYCESYEYCLDDSLLGICVSNLDKKTTRSGEEIDSFTTFLNTPIRIHKYNQEIYDDDESIEDDLIPIAKRPTLGYPIKDDYVFEYESDYEVPESIGDLILNLRQSDEDDYYQDDDDDQESEEEVLSLKKRDVVEDDDGIDELFLVAKEREPRLVKWLYLNRLTNVQPKVQDQDTLIMSKLKTILNENFMIERIFDSIINNVTDESIGSKKQESRKTLLLGVTDLNSKPEKIQNEIDKMDNLFNSNNMDIFSENGQYDIIDSSYIFIELDKKANLSQAKNILKSISLITKYRIESFQDIKVDENLIVFKVDSNTNSSDLVSKLFNKQLDITKETGFRITSCGIGKDNHRFVIEKHPLNIDTHSTRFLIITITACVTLFVVLGVLLIVFWCKRKEYLTQKLIKDVGYTKGDDTENLVQDQDKPKSKLCKFLSCFKQKKCQEKKETLPNQDYQELCRQRMNKNTTVKTAPCTALNMNESTSCQSINSRDLKSDSSRSSTSSWSEEPINSFNIDITTGHVILGYMEEHLNDKNRLNKDWEYLSTYSAEPNKTDIGSLPENMTKNRYSNILPYDHTRVKLSDNKENDYINANLLIDDDPKNPAYIATQGPLIHTSGDFWHMVWEQKSVVIVSLCRTVEYGSLKCNQYWPCNGFEIFDKFEIHLVSEHVWCEDYLVRNFFLKNLDTNQTRTITQFHFLTWPENGVPQNIKSILDFRRKVNKSFKSKSSPLIVHCNDGIGRTGTYILIDMVLNKIQRGAKEIDLAATLEFLRDQRPAMVKNKSQFEFSFAVVIEEVQNMLKALTQ